MISERDGFSMNGHDPAAVSPNGYIQGGPEVRAVPFHFRMR
jgi:hypothetical protein